MVYSHTLSRWSYGDHLEHYGIKGQSWGIRRFQNEDGTLTEEGKQRYLDQMSDKQRNQYLQMPENRRKAVTDKMAEGKSYNQSVREVREEVNARNKKIRSLLITGALLYASPVSRGIIKSAGKAAFRSIAKTKTVQKGALYLVRMMKRNAARKVGATILKKAAYNVL